MSPMSVHSLWVCTVDERATCICPTWLQTSVMGLQDTFHTCYPQLHKAEHITCPHATHIHWHRTHLFGSKLPRAWVWFLVFLFKETGGAWNLKRLCQLWEHRADEFALTSYIASSSPSAREQAVRKEKPLHLALHIVLCAIIISPQQMGGFLLDYVPVSPGCPRSTRLRNVQFVHGADISLFFSFFLPPSSSLSEGSLGPLSSFTALLLTS